jgi:hypothetical protein
MPITVIKDVNVRILLVVSSQKRSQLGGSGSPRERHGRNCGFAERKILVEASVLLEDSVAKSLATHKETSGERWSN